MDVLPQAPPAAIGPTIWFEIEDLVRHFDGAAQPTGIPRVCLEIVKAAQAHYASRIRFCRLSHFSGRFEPVSFAELMALCSSNAYGGLPSSGRRGGVDLREIRRGLRYLWRVGSAILKDSMRRLDWRHANEEFFCRDDILLGIGTGWSNARYGVSIAAAKARYGVRFASLVHDIIPLTHPQYYMEHSNDNFRRWLEQVFENADLIFTSSAHCCDRLIEYSGSEGIKVPPIEVIPFGSAFVPDRKSVV